MATQIIRHFGTVRVPQESVERAVREMPGIMAEARTAWLAAHPRHASTRHALVSVNDAEMDADASPAEALSEFLSEATPLSWMVDADGGVSVEEFGWWRLDPADPDATLMALSRPAGLMEGRATLVSDDGDAFLLEFGRDGLTVAMAGLEGILDAYFAGLAEPACDGR